MLFPVDFKGHPGEKQYRTARSSHAATTVKWGRRVGQRDAVFTHLHFFSRVSILEVKTVGNTAVNQETTTLIK